MPPNLSLLLSSPGDVLLVASKLLSMLHSPTPQHTPLLSLIKSFVDLNKVWVSLNSAKGTYVYYSPLVANNRNTIRQAETHQRCICDAVQALPGPGGLQAESCRGLESRVCTWTKAALPELLG